jgi:NAD(P)-dependent dehydrogenase (short-subunit alcohol dehydrogenase family)
VIQDARAKDGVTRTVLVTGGTGALGTAVTRRFLEDGHRVAATWVVEGEVGALQESLGPLGEDRRVLVETDVTDPASIDGAVQRVASELGPVDVLVHLVGAWKGGERVHEHSVETWDRMLALNLRSAFLCCRAVLPSMLERDWGRVVLVSSRTARQGRSGQAGYAVAKAGVAVLAESIAEETRGTQVTANVIAPSTLDTPANRRAMPDADPARWVGPDDVAASIAYLASEEAGQLRGAWLPVYGSA